MSADCRIIHLHGGPSDGLCLAWNEQLGDSSITVASATVALPEYDYIYLPRVDGEKRCRARQLPQIASQTVQRNRWRGWWSAWQAWLLAPCSYPLDTRIYQSPIRDIESFPKQP